MRLKFKSINNPHPLIESKVNYFIDCCEYFIENAGCTDGYEIETPLSILGSIIYQLEFNQYGGHYVDYIKYYAGKEMLMQDPFVLELDNDKFIDLLRQVVERNDIKKQVHVLLKGASQLNQRLETFYVEKAFTAFYSHIVCQHKLKQEEHDRKLKTFAHLFVSILIQTGRSKAEIREIVEATFQRDSATFPFPVTVSDCEKEEYIKKKDLNVQLQGIINSYPIKPQKANVLVKLWGGVCYKPWQFDYGNVIFCSGSADRITTIKEINVDVGENYFENAKTLFALLPIEYYSPSSVSLTVVRILYPSLAFISQIVGADIDIDHTKAKLVLSESNVGIEIIPGIIRNIHSGYQNEFKKNPYHELNTTVSSAKDYFLKYEAILTVAARDGNVADYWRYLESILKGIEPDRRIKALVASIVVLSEEEESCKRACDMILNNISSLYEGIGGMGFGTQEINDARSQLQKNMLPDGIENKPPYPFLNYCIDDFSRVPSGDELLRAKGYYEGLLYELYEFRNFYFHQSSHNNIAFYKLNLAIPNLISRFRKSIMSCIAEHPAYNFQQIITWLRTRAEMKMATS